MKTVKILKIVKENNDVKTIYFKHNDEISPGQFYMIWIPEVDEIPMSVSYINKDLRAITFRRVGEATKSLFKQEEGDKIGIRGPYGNGFNLTCKKALFVGGGTGIAMLAPTIEQAVKNKIQSTVILGVKNKEELFFVDRIKKTGVKLLITTDDGSYGQKGFATDLVKEILSKDKFDQIYTCGPEVMMEKVFKISNVPLQASLERYMKCGFGLCGQCCVGEGLRVCKEGPIFERKTLEKIDDFGKFKRDSSGHKTIL